MWENMGNQLVGIVFKALSSPTRINILKLLKDGPLCVCKIIEDLGTEQSNTSQHLRALKNAGLIQSRKEGLKVIYSVKYYEVFDIIDTVEKIILMQSEEAQKSIKVSI
ncbi:metalloregulator ArsR/SmtB family transcription factor [Herbivorax sp. ANBcel31]|uniref:ArsR/SmtB family transcription factor n=1 Tax=Herbivorax sp. ANBcel31 TaxID=3069754 RepID=UPI0027B21F7B|nr:metalloregulator ArsR/SmtB family transcription factor [Herbivorax sp. ANBcel31]MDQ2087799.1 metalloregulator ArsR/SmtB family transcription factor [Herbivorax sp. ANBcel31]